jgi:hypothetical protein
VRALALAVMLALAGGCYHTYYHFDAPPLVASQKYTGKWRVSLVAGIIELNEPVSLDKGCPGGQVAMIEEVTTPAGAIIGALINAVVAEFPLVHFRAVTMQCSPAIVAPTQVAPRPQ